MKKRNRSLALFLAMMLAVSTFSGCGGKKTEEPQVTPAQTEAGETGETGETGGEAEWDGNMDNLYVIDIMPPTPLITASMDTAVGQYIAEKFGIAFNYIQYSGDITEKQALMLAGSEYNEIQYMQGEDIFKKYIDAGALLNLDDYKDLMPDFYKRYEKIIPYWRASAADGGLYKWERDTPTETETTLTHTDVLVRTDVLEYYGWPELVSASDWREFLAKAVKDFPTTYDGQATVGMTMPMAESYGIQGIVPVGYEKGDTYFGSGNDYHIYNIKTGQFEEYLLAPEVKESFQFFNNLYKDGTLDEECFTDSADITLQKLSNGRAIAAWYVTWNQGSANQELTNAGHPEMSYIQMPFQLDSQVGQDYMLSMRASYPYYSMGITKNCKYPERVAKFINWCCTDEGQIVLQSGLEGVHYTVENGERVAADLFRQCSQDVEVQKKEGVIGALSGLPLCNSYAEDGQPFNLAQTWEFVDGFSLTDREKEAYAGLGWSTSNQWWNEHCKGFDAGYFQSCALDPSSDLGKVGAKMTEVRVKYSANLLMADDFEAVWNELMAEYDKLDHEPVIEAMNETLAGFTEALK